jgi:hypothetical protein
VVALYPGIRWEWLPGELGFGLCHVLAVAARLEQRRLRVRPVAQRGVGVITLQRVVAAVRRRSALWALDGEARQLRQ